MSTRFGAVERKLNIAITRAVREMTNAIFMKSQANCPVQSGDLRDSGRITNITGGAKIRYTKKYSARREYGMPAGRVIKVRRHRVGGFVGPMNRRVGGHMRGPFSYKSSKEEGSHFLERAVKEETPTLSRRLTRHLRMLSK